MKKNSLTAAVVAGVAGVAGLAGVANAVNINPDGLGQVLIYPYYTVNSGNFTVLSVVNTTDRVKAVKVRFLEAKNSREVLDFNLYLSPFDVWTGAVTSTSSDNSGAGLLTTRDTSCTVPAIPAAGEPFRNFAYTGSFNDDAENNLARTREGHIELIEMGEVGGTFATAATHNATGRPANCAVLRNAWIPGGTWAVDASVNVTGPTGGLFGGAAIVDVANGTAYSYNADAINGFYQLGNAALHTGPGSTQPSLSQAATTLGQADSIIFGSDGSLITLDFVSGTPNAVSSVFMHDVIYNEYNTDPLLNGASEWVITFPTKRLHIESTTAAARLPFANDSDDSLAGTDNLQFDTSGYCEPIDLAYFDREEREPNTPPGGIDFSPPPELDEPEGTNLCWEANVLTFNQEAAVTAGNSLVLGSRNARNVNLIDLAGGADFNEGWIALGLGNANNYLLDNPTAAAGTPRNQIFGLPAVGFWVANFVNTNAAPGLLANYSFIHKHRASFTGRTVTVDGAGVITPTGFAAS